MPQTPAQAAANERRRAFALSQQRGPRGRFLVGTGSLPEKDPVSHAQSHTASQTQSPPPPLPTDVPVAVTPPQTVTTQPPPDEIPNLMDKPTTPTSTPTTAAPSQHATHSVEHSDTRRSEDHLVIPHPDAGKKEGLLDKLKALFS